MQCVVQHWSSCTGYGIHVLLLDLCSFLFRPSAWLWAAGIVSFWCKTECTVIVNLLPVRLYFQNSPKLLENVIVDPTLTFGPKHCQRNFFDAANLNPVIAGFKQPACMWSWCMIMISSLINSHLRLACCKYCDCIVQVLLGSPYHKEFAAYSHSNRLHMLVLTYFIRIVANCSTIRILQYPFRGPFNTQWWQDGDVCVIQHVCVSRSGGHYSTGAEVGGSTVEQRCHATDCWWSLPHGMGVLLAAAGDCRVHGHCMVRSYFCNKKYENAGRNTNTGM